MDNFIGIGRNPNSNSPDLPLGFGMELSQNPKAMAAYGRLSDAEKTRMIKKIQSSTTGQEAKNNVINAINELTKTEG